MVARRNPIVKPNTVLNGIQMVGRLYLCYGFEEKTTMARITPIDVIKGFSRVTPVILLICCNSTFVNQIVRMQWEMPPKFLPSSSQVSPIFLQTRMGTERRCNGENREQILLSRERTKRGCANDDTPS